MVPPFRSRLLAVLLLSGGAVVTWGIWTWQQRSIQTARTPDQPAPFANPTAHQGKFVGSLVCRECHSQIFDTYAGHPMARAVFPIGEADVVEDYQKNTSFSSGPRVRYQVEQVGNRVVHHEVGLDLDDKPVFDQAEEVHYAIGSGRRGRSYVIDRDGLLFMSPISWYSEKGCWDLSPGYEPNQHPRFERRASERCLQCHVGRLSYVKPTVGADFEPYDRPPFAEAGIGCERCHGPGEAHANWHRRINERVGSDPIVNPSKLSPSRRDDVCNQCHLQGEFQVLRYGRSHGDFRPGHLVGDVWSIFVQGTRIDKSGSTEAVSQVEQMRASRCFVSSQGRLGCTTCHDPHLLPNDREKTKFFDSRCLTCHQPDHCTVTRSGDPKQRTTDSGSCIECHMPRLSAHDVPHTTQTDHRILRHPSAGSAQPVASADSQPLEIFESDECQLPTSEETLARGVFLIELAKMEQDKKQAAQAEKLLLTAQSSFNDDVRILDGLAFCAVLDGRPSQATELWLRAIALRPDNAEIAHSLAIQMMNRGEMTRAHQFVDLSLRLDPWRSEMHLSKSKLLLRRGDLVSALSSANRALALNPSDPSTYQWLAEVCRMSGQNEKSQDYEARRARLLGGTQQIKKLQP